MLTYYMDGRGAATKTMYLYRCIRGDIISGVLSPGEKLPSRRALADHLGISSITVENAYMMLEEEGYIESRARSGFFVSEMQTSLYRPKRGRTEAWEAPAERLRLLPPDSTDAVDADFPAMARIMRKTLSDHPYALGMKPPHLGCAVLRNAIATYLLRSRGMHAQPENIVIGSGAEYLYGLVVQLFGRDRRYGIEDPSYEKIRAVYEANGASCELLAMGEDGIRQEALAASRADVLHVTPFHSYPSGVTASVARRLAYLAWAEERNAYLIEDDFDSEFAFPRKPIETLYSMDNGGRVIYINTFSKSIAPSFRIGYMILPPALMSRFKEHLGFYSCTVPVFDQYVLAEFIGDGSFERQLARKQRQVRSGKDL